MKSLRSIRSLLRRSSSVLAASLAAAVPLVLTSSYVQPTAAQQAAQVDVGQPPSLIGVNLAVTSLPSYRELLSDGIQYLQGEGYAADAVVKEIGRQLAINYQSSVPPMTLAQLDGIVDYTIQILRDHYRLSAAQIRKYLTDGLIEALGESPGFGQIAVQQHFVRAAYDDLEAEDFPGLGEAS